MLLRRSSDENEGSWTTHRGHVLLQGLSGEAGCVVDDRSKVGGAPELELREALLVGLNYTLDPWKRAAAALLSRPEGLGHRLSHLHKTDWRG